MRGAVFLALTLSSLFAQSTQKVSVVGDATYLIAGPICSGSGVVPVGVKCPIKGDIAIESCLPSLRSSSNGKCVAPVDAACKKIPSGAWGCVWSNADVPATTKGSDAITYPPTTSVVGMEHVVMFKWKNSTNATAIDAVGKAIIALKDKIPGIVDLSYGEDFVKTRNNGYTHMLVVRLEKKEALPVYTSHPEHVKVATSLKEMAESIMGLDFDSPRFTPTK
ncbi:Aste57867_16310 [Aphanomyces stellatus]|uniref:Aste57867_16310 protein n=1 Tax=Aphanomyces stellatus TaxID=120398 RepID=A0A485L6D6_9STRA|nr:hypothetical protein As57867_016253 [Aphanomyces stellatus]VFT93086.1 Aste57867_16310 [Aphanomyces stellatus]